MAAATNTPAVPTSLIAATDTWSLWLVLLSCATAGLMAERTKLGAALSSPLVTMLLTLALCNLGAIPFDAPLYSSVNRFLVPMAVPLLLFGADLRRLARPLRTPPRSAVQPSGKHVAMQHTLIFACSTLWTC